MPIKKDKIEREYYMIPCVPDDIIWVVSNDTVAPYTVYKIIIEGNSSTIFAKSNISPFFDIDLNSRDYNKTWFKNKNKAIQTYQAKEFKI